MKAAPYANAKEWMAKHDRVVTERNLAVTDCQRAIDRAVESAAQVDRLTKINTDLLKALEEIRESYFALAKIAGKTAGGTTNVDEWPTIKIVDAAITRAKEAMK